MSQKISDFTAATLPLAGTETIPVLQGGTNKRTTLRQIANLNIGSLIGKLNGADFSRMKFTYGSLTGGTFTIGDTITGQTSTATGTVISDNGTDTVVIGSINGTFSNIEVIDNGSGVTATVSSIDP